MCVQQCCVNKITDGAWQLMLLKQASLIIEPDTRATSKKEFKEITKAITA